MAKIWVYAEQSEGRPAGTALELVTKARELLQGASALLARRMVFVSLAFGLSTLQ